MSTKRTDIDDFEVWWKYEQEGMSYKEIAEYYGVYENTIYYRLHPEKKRDYNKHYCSEHREESKERSKTWSLENIKKKKEISDKWRLDNPEYDKQYQLNHPDRIKIWRQDTEKGRASVVRHNAERRQLGSIELNMPFPDSEGHHIDDTYIIHMPAYLHRSIRHNVRTGHGVEEINTIAFQYITEEMFDKLIGGEI